jgi:hypothetical protein|nr:MAG TPA: hypothetical protein [Caudoviricetes sp.]
MASIKIETGLKTYDIEDENGNIRGQITINPKDMSFFGKALKMRDTILHYMDDLDVNDSTKTEQQIIDIFDNTDKIIKEEIDKLFGEGTSIIIFGQQSSLSTINGVTFVERFLSAFMPIIQEEFKQEIQNSSARIDKYVSQVK